MKPILTFDTTRPEPVFIAIGPKTYRLIRPSDLSLARQIRLDRVHRDIVAMQTKVDDLTADDEARLSTCLCDLVNAVVEAPQEVLDQLVDNQRMAITVAFFNLRTLPGVPKVTKAKPKRARR